MNNTPSWYHPDGDDLDLLLSATIQVGSWGEVTIEDPTEFSRRKVQQAQIAMAKKLGIKPGDVADAMNIDLDVVAEFHASKLAAYVVNWPDGEKSLGSQARTLPWNSDLWCEAMEKIPGKVLDRIIEGIDRFTGAEGNVPLQASETKPATSSSAPKLHETDGIPSSSSTSSTGHAPGSSPVVEDFSTSHAG